MVRPIRFWVFLDGGRFAAKAPSPRGWVSLDSLVRIETFQWVTRTPPRKKILALSPARGARNGSVLGPMREAGLVMGMSLAWFLTFRKRLFAPEIAAPSGPLKS